MDIISKFTKITKFAVGELSKPAGFTKGEDFEKYVRVKLFPEEKYQLLHQSHSYATNKERYVDESKAPDYKFMSKINKKEFYVEAKYRSKHMNAIEWCKLYQLKRYQAIDKETPVFVVLAVGNTASSPEDIYLIPIKDIKYTKLFQSFLKKYECNPGQPVDYRSLQL